ncbi:MAG: hypothetical protein GY928_34465 [Colwellia sp.]|nr:hypothetical protein [Colwellia sp.]
MVTNRIHDKLQSSLPFFAKQALYIKGKEDGKIQPFIFNKAQTYLHNRIEAQLIKKGRARIIILKGRQQGCSTYAAARGYHKSTRNKGVAVFILSHEYQTTTKLFAMVDRFQQNVPEALRPHTSTYNNKQIKFDELDSEYTTGTAGNEDVGRGGTLQYFHGSEVGFWENTDGIETGIMQSIADVDGTEIILESTANGMGNMFHRKCMAAMRGEGDYELVFIPWFWQTEYRRYVPENFILTDEEALLQEGFALEDEQIFWRRKKIEELGTDWKFRQEYPMTVKDAFVTSGASLVNGDSILKAKKAKIKDNQAPLILGVDMGRDKDRTVIMPRRGREVLPFTVYDPEKEGVVRQTTVAARLERMLENQNVDKIFIDIAKGYGVIDILVEDGYGDKVRGVYFNEGAIENDKYSNKRAEMHILARDWIESEAVSIPDNDELEIDIASIPDYKETINGLIKIPPKEEIKKILGRSPDLWDAFILTFAYPVASSIRTKGSRLKKIEGKSPFKTRKRVASSGAVSLSTSTKIWGM